MKYTVFDQLKQRVLRRQSDKFATENTKSSPASLSAFSAFLLGAISKSVATVLTYPAIRYTVQSLLDFILKVLENRVKDFV